jgi:hypothetical protein
MRTKQSVGKGKELIDDHEEYELMMDGNPHCVESKKRIKPVNEDGSHGRNGHTLRFNYCFPYNDKNVVICRGQTKFDPFGNKKNDKDCNEVAITEIDHYFDSTFMCPNGNGGSFRYSQSSSYRPLNNPVKWEEVEDLLWSKAISVGREYSSYYGFTYHFEIPILGHCILNKDDEYCAEDYTNGIVTSGGIVLPYHLPQQLDNEWSWWMSKKCSYLSTVSKSQRRKQRMEVQQRGKDTWLCWNGKYYNPNYIYEFIEGSSAGNSGHLRPLCPYVARNADDPHMQLGPIVKTKNALEDQENIVRNKHAYQGNVGTGKSEDDECKKDRKNGTITLNKLAAVAYYEPSITASEYHSRFYQYATNTNTSSNSSASSDSTSEKKKKKRRKSNKQITEAEDEMLGKGKEHYAEIELPSVSQISHIGLVGGYPQHLRFFPDRSKREYNDEDVFATRNGEESDEANPKVHNHGRRNGAKRFRKRKSQRGRPHVPIIKHNIRDIAWVRQYRVFYRDVQSGKWVPYQQGNIFAGNEDLSTEVQSEVSITARSLRIVPVSYHHAIAMRVMVYGTPLPSSVPSASMSSSSIAGMNQEKIPTIQYSLSIPQRSPLRIERSTKSTWKKYCMDKHLPVIRKKAMELDLRVVMKERAVEKAQEIDDTDSVYEFDPERDYEEDMETMEERPVMNLDWEKYL